MAAAIAAAIGVSALGAVAQYYQAEKARKASEERLNEIRDMFNAIKPPDYDVTIDDPPEYITQTVPEPEIDVTKLTPKQFEKIGTFMPEIAPYIAEQAPQLVKDTDAAKKGKDARLEVLEKFRETARTGRDLEMEAGLGDAARRSQIEAQSRQQSILQDAARRGQLGSGLMFAAQLQGAESAMDRNAQTSQQAALEAYRNQLQAMRDEASLGGQISQQEFSEQSRNADIINDFNARTSRNANQYAQQRADTLNNAQLKNLDVAQQLANRNVETANQFAVDERNNKNKLLQYLHGLRTDERDFQNRMKDKQFQNTVASRDRANTFKSQAYNDQLARASGSAGISNQYNVLDQNRARDTNAAIQGVTDALSGGLASYNNAQARQSAAGQAANQQKYENTGRYMTDQEIDEYNRQRDRF